MASTEFFFAPSSPATPAALQPISTLMQISDARARYRETCSLTNGQAPFEDLVGKLIESGYAESFHNDSYFDALWLTHHMFNRSYKTVSMITGPGGHGFLQTLLEPVEAALKRLSNNAGHFRVVVFDPKPDAKEFFDNLHAKYQGIFKYFFAKASRPLGHFIVCDGKMIRLEEPHAEFNDDTPASVIRAKVNFNDPTLSKVNETFFTAVWERMKLALSEQRKTANT